jgi:hypothetical protein
VYAAEYVAITGGVFFLSDYPGIIEYRGMFCFFLHGKAVLLDVCTLSGPCRRIGFIRPIDSFVSMDN